MSKPRNIVFLTGSRTDFGKLKSLISITQGRPKFDAQIFVTGMHMDAQNGSKVNDIYPTITNVSHNIVPILKVIEQCGVQKQQEINISEFGSGNSDQIFLDLLLTEQVWNVNYQKQFQDRT